MIGVTDSLPGVDFHLGNDLAGNKVPACAVVVDPPCPAVEDSDIFLACVVTRSQARENLARDPDWSLSDTFLRYYEEASREVESGRGKETFPDIVPDASLGSFSEAGSV